MAFFDKLKQALRNTWGVINTDVRTLFVPGRQIDEQFLTDLEEGFLQADMGVKNVQRVTGEIREQWRLGKIRNAGEAKGVVREKLLEIMGPAGDRELKLAAAGPTVILVAGVNGAGKTTSIAKLAWLLKSQGKKVMLCASDTFRAGAVHQLSIWAERLGVEIIKHKMGSDPAAVAYDACEAAKARGADALIVDTAGRLPTQEPLIRELVKIRDVTAKRIEGAPHEVLLVLDATTGQNAIEQVRVFGRAINVSGLLLAKLDGTAKGGAVVAIREQLRIPVKFIGVGETPEDIEPFDAGQFVDALLNAG